MSEALDPTPFLRGNPFAGTPAVPYPRALAADVARLPCGTWQAAAIPAGVRLELRGDAEALVVDYHTDTRDLGPRGDGAGRAFEVWDGDSRLASCSARLGDDTIEIPLPAAGRETTVYLPEGMRPTLRALTPVNGSVEPAPARPRWLAYGDSITEGWVASTPPLSWPARVARQLGLDVCNLGYAGAARGELVSAEHLAAVEASVITLAFGTNCWSTIPHTAALLTAVTDAFLTILRQGHPSTPVVVATPVLRPSAETAPNRMGATLQDLRAAMAAVVRGRIDRGDAALVLVDGEQLLDERLLADGIHPGDEGHAVMTARLAPVIREACARPEVLL